MNRGAMMKIICQVMWIVTYKIPKSWKIFAKNDPNMRGIHMSSLSWSFVDCNPQQPTTNMKLCSHGETLSSAMRKLSSNLDTGNVDWSCWQDPYPAQDSSSRSSIKEWHGCSKHTSNHVQEKVLCSFESNKSNKKRTHEYKCTTPHCKLCIHRDEPAGHEWFLCWCWLC